jgi:hypothetical protein
MGVTTHKTYINIFTAVRASNLVDEFISTCSHTNFADCVVTNLFGCDIKGRYFVRETSSSLIYG